MSDLQSKLGGGLNKLQDSLNQGKQKLQVVQEISQYNKIISEGLENRAKIIFELGEEAYRKLRNRELNDAVLLELAGGIISIDQKVYQARKMVAQLNATSQQTNQCSGCGTALTPGDKFCGTCGQKAEQYQEQETVEMTTCPSCEEEVPAHTTFCSCCGIRLASY